MAKGFRVEFAKSAGEDLLDMVARHTSQQVPEVGKRLVAAVLERVGQLALFPDSGRIVPEFDTPWLRELEMPPYRIVYRRDDAVVTVVRVLALAAARLSLEHALPAAGSVILATGRAYGAAL